MKEVWDLHNQIEKQKSTCHVFLLPCFFEQLNRDLHHFSVELDTELLTMVMCKITVVANQSVNEYPVPVLKSAASLSRTIKDFEIFHSKKSLEKG